MKLYAVTLWHAKDGEHTFLINATNHLNAIESVLDHTKAPPSAVMCWEEATPKQVHRWRKETGIR